MTKKRSAAENPGGERHELIIIAGLQSFFADFGPLDKRYLPKELPGPQYPIQLAGVPDSDLLELPGVRPVLAHLIRDRNADRHEAVRRINLPARRIAIACARLKAGADNVGDRIVAVVLKR